MKDSKFNSLSYDVLFTSIAYDLIELEVIHNLSIKPAATVRHSPVFFPTYVALQSRGLESAGGHGVIPVPQRLMIRCRRERCRRKRCRRERCHSV